MSPSEKAKELLRLFSFIEFDQNEGVKIHNPTLKEAANQCAIICCDLLIEVTGNADDLVNKLIGIMSESDKKYFEKANESKAQIYWHSVKTEIQKL